MKTVKDVSAITGVSIRTLRYTVSLGTDLYGNIQRLDNGINSLEVSLKIEQERLERAKTQLASAKVEVERPFPREDELKKKTARLNELNALLDLDKHESEIVDDEREESDTSKKREYER